MKITTKHFLALALIVSIIACGKPNVKDYTISNTIVDDNYTPIYTAKQLTDRLKLSDEDSLSDGFDQFFSDWNKEIEPNSLDFIFQNDTINNVFNVYKALYKPLDLLKLGDWEWGNELNSKCKFVVVQNKIYYAVLITESFEDTDMNFAKRDSIINFRPPIDLDKSKVLYLTDEYDKALNDFLGSESTELGEGNLMNPSMPKGNSEKRYEKIRSFIPVLHGHWGGYWHLDTHPSVENIVFNNTMTKAKVEFRVGYQGGEATLEKKGKEWLIKESRATWIE